MNKTFERILADDLTDYERALEVEASHLEGELIKALGLIFVLTFICTVLFLMLVNR